VTTLQHVHKMNHLRRHAPKYTSDKAQIHTHR